MHGTTGGPAYKPKGGKPSKGKGKGSGKKKGGK